MDNSISKIMTRPDIKTANYTQTSILNFQKAKEQEPILHFDDGFVDLQKELHSLDLML